MVKERGGLLLKWGGNGAFRHALCYAEKMSTEKDPKKMQNLLDQDDSGLRKIVRQAQRLSAVNRIVQTCLPENCRPHCRVAQITPSELTLAVASAAWLMPLRYVKSQLIQQLRQHPQCAYLRDIQFRILPTQIIEEKTTPPELGTLSPENQELLQMTAENVSHPLLKRSLKKLAG